ncbi:MAG: DNA-directed DNA polymerase [Nanoarchaeota archaeon]|nr:DNA-directed DNA polymerase [Nanoarchaeota archaeon]
MKTEFIPLDYDSFDFEGRNYVRVIGRDRKGKRICVIDLCQAYLWVIIKDSVKKERIKKISEKIEEIRLDLKGRETRVEKVELHKKNFLGKEKNALKVFATNYKDLQDIAGEITFSEVESRRGYDINFITHYIIEKNMLPLQWHEVSGEIAGAEFQGIENLDVDFCIKLESSKVLPPDRKGQTFKPRVLTYDIETDDLAIGGGEILMISLVSDDFERVITWKKDSKKLGYVEYVKDEAELLERFVESVKEISPDFLVGYFSDGFDLPYLKARAEHHNVRLSLGLDDSKPKFSRGVSMSGKISGIVHIDLLKFIRTAYAQYMQSETLSLNEVAKEFLGDKKVDFEFKHSSKINDEDWDKYFEYNLYDSKLVKDLFEKFWPDIAEFVRVLQEPIFEVTRAGLSRYTESYILHNLQRFNEIPERRPGHDEISKRRGVKVEGAFVFEPTPGLYEDIAMFDFTSMHTSIIITHNLSKSTLLEKKDKNSHESPEIEEGEKKVRYYFEKEPGFFPELMKEIFELRKKAKEEYKKNPDSFTRARSNAFKVLSASAHGYVAFFGARYYSHEASASILAFVRKYNKETIDKVEKEGYKVIFGDTDSVAFLMNGKTKSDVKKFLDRLNSELPGVMHLELEDFYKRGLWVTKRSGTIGAKKKYALIGDEGKLKIRGFETVRRDWCRLAREVQNNVLRQVLDAGNEKESLDYVKKIVKKIKSRDVDRKDLMIKTVLQKPLADYKAISPHVIAARRMKEKDLPMSGGNLIEYYISETSNKKALVRDRVKLPEEKGEYDIDYYLERQILPAVENIFQVFGVNLKEVLGNKKQMNLGDF